MERYTRFLLKHRVQVIILFVAAAAVCAVLSGLVGVNYKFADYLPEEAASTRAIEVMEEEYRQAVPNMRVLVYDVSIPEALEYKDRLKTAEGVQEVSWLDDAVNIYEPLEMAPQKTIDEWYKDGNALFSVTVDEEKEEEAVAAVREIIGDENCMAGAAVESVVAPADTFVDEPVETGKPLLPGGAEGVHRMLEQFVQIEPHFLHAVEALLRKAAREDHSPPLEIVADARPGHELLVDAHDEVAGLHGDGPAVDDHVGLAPFALVEHHEVDAVHPVGALDVVEVGEGEYLGARVLRARGHWVLHAKGVNCTTDAQSN